MRHAELAGLVSRLTPGLQPIAIFVRLGNTRIDVTVADISIPVPIPRHVGHLAKHAVNRRQRRLGMLEGAGVLVGGLLLTAEYHKHAPLWIELNDHVRSLVRYPDVVLGVDLNGVAVRPGIEVVTDFTNVLAVRAELEQLRCGG